MPIFWWCSVLQCVAVCCSVLQSGAVWCSVLQCVAVCVVHIGATHARVPHSALRRETRRYPSSGAAATLRAWNRKDKCAPLATVQTRLKAKRQEKTRTLPFSSRACTANNFFLSLHFHICHMNGAHQIYLSEGSRRNQVTVFFRFFW